MASPFEALNAAGKAAYDYYQQVYCQGDGTPWEGLDEDNKFDWLEIGKRSYLAYIRAL